MTDRDKLIELIHDGVGCPDGRHPFGDVCDGCKYFPSLDCNTERLADSLIANGVAVSKNETTTQRWISVEDEKPKRRGHYFISYVFRCSDIRFYGEAMWHDDMEGNGYVTGPHFSNEGMDNMRVTHWMEIPRIPLSEPPKEG